MTKEELKNAKKIMGKYHALRRKNYCEGDAIHTGLAVWRRRAVEAKKTGQDPYHSVSMYNNIVKNMLSTIGNIP